MLDRLLEDDRIEIEGISGASSGAVNAVTVAHGYTVNGREGARQALRDLWESVASKAPFTFIPDNLSTPADIDSKTSNNLALKLYLSLARFFRLISSIRSMPPRCATFWQARSILGA